MLSDFGSCALPISNKLKTNVGTQNFQAPYVGRISLCFIPLLTSSRAAKS